MENSEAVLAEVVDVITRTGPGGGCQYAKLRVISTNRTLTRIIQGPVREGDKLYLLEAERDQKVGRR